MSKLDIGDFKPLSNYDQPTNEENDFDSLKSDELDVNFGSDEWIPSSSKVRRSPEGIGNIVNL